MVCKVVKSMHHFGIGDGDLLLSKRERLSSAEMSRSAVVLSSFPMNLMISFLGKTLNSSSF